MTPMRFHFPWNENRFRLRVLLLCFAFCFFSAAHTHGLEPESAADADLPAEAEALPETLAHPSGDESPEEPEDPDEWDSEEVKALRGDDALDDLMRFLRGPFDGAAHGLEGHYVVVAEERGVLEPNGMPKRIRLVALRREGGVYDRALLLEVTPPGEPPLLIPLPEDVRGIGSRIDLKNFISRSKHEVFVATRSGRGAEERFLIIGLENREGRIIFDSRTTRLPTIRGRFFDNYRAEIFVEETQTRGLIDLSSRREQYARSFVYNEPSGRLRSPVTMWWNRFSEIEAVDVNGDGVLELRGLIVLHGAGRTDRVAYVAPTMRFWDGEWVILSCLVVPVEDLSNFVAPIRVN